MKHEALDKQCDDVVWGASPNVYADTLHILQTQERVIFLIVDSKEVKCLRKWANERMNTHKSTYAKINGIIDHMPKEYTTQSQRALAKHHSAIAMRYEEVAYACLMFMNQFA